MNPGGPAWRPWSPARVPAFWVLLVVVLMVGGVVLLLSAILLVYTPWSGVLTVPLVLGYAGLWLALVLRVLDPVESRPVWLGALAVGWGATAACAVGIGAGVYLDDLVAKAVSPAFAAAWGPALSAPTAEELAKVAGVVLVLLAARPYVGTVWSGAVYGALVGIGFAATEDAGYALTYADMALPDDTVAAGQVLLLRFSTPGIAGHPLFTAVAGAGVAYAWLRTDRTPTRRAGVLFAALGTAWVMHGFVNAPLAAHGADALAGLGWVAGWAGYILIASVPSVPALCWLLAVRRADSRLLLHRLAALLPGALSVSEVPALTAYCARSRADRRLRRERGRAAVRAAHRLRRAQLRLAGAVARPYRGYPVGLPAWSAPQVNRWSTEVLQARAELDGRAPIPNRTA